MAERQTTASSTVVAVAGSESESDRISGGGVLPAVPMVGTTITAIIGAGGRGGISSSSSLSPPPPSRATTPTTATATTITGGASGGGDCGVSITSSNRTSGSGCHALNGEESTGTGTMSVGATTMVDNREGGQGIIVVIRKQAKTMVGNMVMMIIDSGWAKVILKFLPLADLCNFYCCNKTLCKLGTDDSRFQRLIIDRLFTQTYSKSWWFWVDRLEDQKYADDFSFNELSRYGEKEKDFHFLDLFAMTEPHMLKSIAAWCGGWDTFIQSRYEGAKRAYVSTVTTKSVRAGDNNKVHHLCKPIIISDIHRENKWQWTALHPLCDDDIRTLGGDPEDKDNYGVFYPYSTKSLGDPTCSGTAYCWNHGRRPPRYLLSTDSTDNRTYKFSVSIVSPNFAETFVKSVEIVPMQICCDNTKVWRRGTKNSNSRVARDESFRECSDLLMYRHVVADDDDEDNDDDDDDEDDDDDDDEDDDDDDDDDETDEDDEENDDVVKLGLGNFGQDEDGKPIRSSPQFQFTYYRDNRGEQERFHVVMECWFKTTHFYDMWVHPPAHNATWTMVKKGSRSSRKSRKRKLLSILKTNI